MEDGRAEVWRSSGQSSTSRVSRDVEVELSDEEVGWAEMWILGVEDG